MRRDLINKDGDYFGIFDPLFDEFFDFPVIPQRRKELADIMKTDVREVGEEYKIDIELPGYKKEDVSMDLENGYLIVSAKKEENKEDSVKEHNYIRRERRFGACTRSFYVGDIKEEDIKAKLENGVLTISIPKEVKKLETKKKIEIE